jgi:hypothetical protein
LRIVECDEHRRLCGKQFDDRSQRRGHDTLIDRRAVATGAQQDTIDGDTLHLGEVGKDGRLDIVKKVSHRGVCQRGLCLPAAGRQYSEPEITRLGHAGEPQRGLADAGLALDDQPAGPRYRGLQQVVNGPDLSGTFDDAGSQSPPLVDSTPTMPPVAAIRR